MTNILDRVAALSGRFRVTNVHEFLAFQIARKLGDAENARQYAILAEHYPDAFLIKAFRKCAAEGDPSRDSFLRHFRNLTHQES